MEESRLSQWSVIRSIIAILQWWGFNVTVIIMNKWIFQVLKLKPLIAVDPEDQWRRIFPMSFVFCINIVLGNVSLRYIPVSFMQTIKSFTPATTVALQWLVWSKHFDWRIWASLVPIVGGILLTSMTELSFNMFGFCAALFGCLATSTKTILAESLLHGYKFDRSLLTVANLVAYCSLSVLPYLFDQLIFSASYGSWAEFCLLFLIGTVDSDIWPSINTVYYMAPYATMILAGPALLLEGPGVVQWFQTHTSLLSALTIIFGSGVLAFCLNFSIFYVIHSTTAVTFNVAGNLKFVFERLGEIRGTPKRLGTGDTLGNPSPDEKWFSPALYKLAMAGSVRSVLYIWKARNDSIFGNKHPNLEGCSCRYMFMADISKPYLGYECRRMCCDTRRLYILWLCEALALPTAARNSPHTPHSAQPQGVDSSRIR
ncbi:hypothetical protein RHMOL_Rhmol06G0150200 [Rhododendron molle]|uniref:Uncharacterized protein n=1 Tax=Rhododendron molle TaxID=49168 RepID=A0ACC0NCP3_RHOML|nr:hypothetical protein RHMOL_Rhmol06G0150200 [Rhododendron molle]